MDELQQTWRTVIKPLIAKYDLVFPKPFFTPLPTKFDLIRLERDIQQRIDNFGIDIRDLFSCLANGITDGPRRGGKPLDLKRMFWGLLNSCFKERTLPALLRHLREVGVVVARPVDDIPERERPELPRYADYVFRQACELHDLEHGPCEDVARKQIRIEELKARIESISKDCTRLKGEGSDDSSLAISYAVRQWKIKPKLSSKEMIFMVESEAGLSRKYAYDTIRKWIQRYHPDHEPGKRGRKGIPKNA